ncbi:MAG: sugar phosphate isomerase/epimerase [Saprospiraceae bacterium]|nr:sugar phosphate isomerase/epimerase [Saprospiraceae bacterium]
MNPLSKLCLHTITNKPWPLPELLDKYAATGVGGVSVWQNAVEPYGISQAASFLAAHSIEVVSYVRGGFFPGPNHAARQQAINDNKVMIEEAAALGAPILVLVCGAEPTAGLVASRNQIQDGIEAILPHCQAHDVKLAIEPLHPMYADTRSAINTLEQANDMAEIFDCEHVGVAVDVYHLWWDPHLEKEIKRCGSMGNLLAYHICDWKYPPEDMLNDRGLMGEGCIPIAQISEWVSATGFTGMHEVEIFSNRYWSMNQDEFLSKIVHSYKELYHI